MKPYAEGTSVPVDKTKADLEALLAKHGIVDTAVVNSGTTGQALVIFTIGKTPLDRRQVRIGLPLPKLEEFAKQRVRGLWRLVPVEKQRKAWEQACRERWRLLYLVVKAKLEAVAGGISTAEKEFLAFVALPAPIETEDGRKGGGDEDR